MIKIYICENTIFETIYCKMKLYSKPIQTIIKFEKVFSHLLNELIVSTKNIWTRLLIQRNVRV